MATVTMSLYKALEQKKIYEERVKAADPRKKVFFGRYTEGNKTINGLDLETAGIQMKGNFDSYVHLVSNVRALQVAINKANLENTVVIPGYNNDEPVTLVEVITEYKNLDKRVAAVNAIQRQLESIQADIKSENERVLDPNYVYSQIAKAGTNDKKTENTSEVLQKNIEDFTKKNTVHLFDPAKIVESDWIKKELAEIEQFQLNIHAAIMEKNVQVMITVELED